MPQSSANHQAFAESKGSKGRTPIFTFKKVRDDWTQDIYFCDKAKVLTVEQDAVTTQKKYVQ